MRAVRARSALAGAAVAIAMLLSGCTSGVPTAPRASELAGRWHADDDGSLVLRADGTGTAAALFLQGHLVTGPCTWRVGDFSGNARDRAGVPVLGLAFGTTSSRPGYRVVLEVDGSGPARTLVRTIDEDRDQRFELHR